MNQKVAKLLKDITAKGYILLEDIVFSDKGHARVKIHKDGVWGVLPLHVVSLAGMRIPKETKI